MSDLIPRVFRHLISSYAVSHIQVATTSNPTGVILRIPCEPCAKTIGAGLDLAEACSAALRSLHGAHIPDSAIDFIRELEAELIGSVKELSSGKVCACRVPHSFDDRQIGIVEFCGVSKVLRACRMCRSVYASL